MKQRGAALVAAAVACLALGAPAAAQNSNSDARCLLVSNIFAKAATNVKAREAANLASFFYLGRLDGRMAGPRLAATLVAQQKTITTANAGAVMNGCVQYMARRRAALQALGQRLN